MLMIDELKAWYRSAPSPVAWLLMTALLYVWLLVVASVGAMLAGGYNRLVEYLPSYAKDTALKLAGLYSINLFIYLLVRVVQFCIRKTR